MATNIDQLPLLEAVTVIGSNEDWLDSWAFRIADQAVAYPATGNTGNGTLGAIAVGAATPIGDIFVEVLSVTATTVFGVQDAAGNQLGIGTIGVPFTGADLVFTASQGGVHFDVKDKFTIAVSSKPIDLTGIFFSFAMGGTDIPINVVLSGNTVEGSLVNGGTSGTLAFDVAHSRIEPLLGTYGFDVLATADTKTKRVITGKNTVVNGYSFKYAV